MGSRAFTGRFGVQVGMMVTAVLLFSCGGTNSGSVDDFSDFVKGQTWIYQLQDGNLDSVGMSGFHFAVLDYSSNGRVSGVYTRAAIQALETAGMTTVAYLSIGEAENYRFYWDASWVSTVNSNDFTASAPAWLGRTNPDWFGNYKVRYWDLEWRDNYLKPYLDKILAQGFQGVYLDIIDAFEYWSDAKNFGPGKETAAAGDPINDEAEAARRMIELVKWIASYCRAQSEVAERFLVLPQNGVRILEYDTDNSFMNTVSGIGVEDVWYEGTEKKSDADIDERLTLFRRFVDNGKFVLAVDYVDDASGFSGANRERILDFAQKCILEKFLYYAARSDRELNIVNSIPEVQP